MAYPAIQLHISVDNELLLIAWQPASSRNVQLVCIAEAIKSHVDIKHTKMTNLRNQKESMIVTS